ncbi:MAG: FAD-dependent hydroxylase [Candidatus Atelocyanobacterium thalassa]
MTLQPATLNQLDSTSYLECDLAIVGGGIAGTTLALALKESGLKIKIIESQTLEKVACRERAYALSLLSGRIFNGIGIWSKILPEISKFNYIFLSDADFSEVVKFKSTDLKTDSLGYVGEHKVILDILQNETVKYPNIQLLSSTKVVKLDTEKSKSIVNIEKDDIAYKLRAKLVVGADGPLSFVRSSAEIKTQGWKYWQSCLTFIIKHQASRNDIAFERFWYTGPLAILPLPNNRCQIVWTLPHAQAKALHDLEDTEFLAQLKTHIPKLLGSITLMNNRSLFPVQLMQSKNYIQPRLALVGDAAHCCHPVGGQGLNLGIRDVAVLAEILEKAWEKGEDIGSQRLLKEYESLRRRENWIILGFTDFLDRLFSNNYFLLVLMRRFGLVVINQIPLLKNNVLRLMTGLSGKQPILSKK